MADYLVVPDLLYRGQQVYTLAVSPAPSPEPTPTPTPAPVPPSYALPPEVIGRSVILQPFGSLFSGLRIISARDLDDSNVWVIPFSIPNQPTFRDARLAGGQWQQQACDRIMKIIRNHDGLLIYTLGENGGVTTPSVNFTYGTGIPSYKPHIDKGVEYTAVVWNRPPTPVGSGRMFMELYF